MNCNADSLMDQARCFRCIPTGVQRSVWIYLLCQLSASGVSNRFSYSPRSATITWSDTNGSQGGDLDFFEANADIPTVSQIDLSFQGITRIRNIQTLPALTSINVRFNSLTSLDVTGCTNLVHLDCYSNQIASLPLTGCTSLQTLDCNNNSLSTLNITPCTAITTVDAYSCKLKNVQAQNCVNLTYLNVNNNLLGTVYITNDFAITYLSFVGNPSISFVGP